jgi:flagellar hook-associated protein FlgK
VTKLLQIKSDSTNKLREIQKLNTEIVGRTASSSQIDKLLDEKDRAIAELEQKLGRLRQESQKIANDKEHEEVEILKLQDARHQYEKEHNEAEVQFHNVLNELRRKQLT